MTSRSVPLLSNKPKVSNDIMAGRKAVKRIMDILDSAVSNVAPSPSKIAKSEENWNITDKFNNGNSDCTWNLEVESPCTESNLVPLDMLRLHERHTPLDVTAFLRRLKTFVLRLWPAKHYPICSFVCARYGWKIAGKNTLVCVSCRSILCVPAEKGNTPLQEYLRTIELQIKKTGHISGCIWVKSPSPPDILQIPAGSDLKTYIQTAASSFKMLKTVPTFTHHYQSVVERLDMSGLKTQFHLNIGFKVDDEKKETVIDTILFLILNGWTMENAICDDVIQCILCQRELLLCLFKPHNCSALRETTFVLDKAFANYKEMDPLMEHEFWCPWKKFLKSYVETSNNESDWLLCEENEDSLALNYELLITEKAFADCKSYIRMAHKFDAELKKGKLVLGNCQMSDPVVAHNTMLNLLGIMNSTTGNEKFSSDLTYFRPNDPKSDESFGNDLVKLKPLSQSVVTTSNCENLPSIDCDTVTNEDTSKFPQSGVTECKNTEPSNNKSDEVPITPEPQECIEATGDVDDMANNNSEDIRSNNDDQDEFDEQEGSTTESDILVLVKDMVNEVSQETPYG